MQQKAQGKMIGAMLLIAGSCIGAGMIAMPILTGIAGFFPALCITLVAWAFMTSTALLLVEVNGWFHKQINIISMAERALGRWGEITAWVLYLFLFYALLVAYVAMSSEIVSSFLLTFLNFSMPKEIAGFFFTLIFALFIYFGTGMVDRFNRYLILGLIISYFGMLFLGVFEVQIANLSHVKWQYSLIALPVLITSFGFHNMIPSLTAYIGDVKKTRNVIIGGSLIALGCYLIWEWLMIGVVPYDSIFQSYQNKTAADYALRKSLGTATVVYFAQGFSFFAIITSFLAQGLSLTHFIADGLKVKLGAKNNLWLLLLSLGPPCLLGIFYPHIFFTALSFAGGICAVALFGFLPVLMAWEGRYVQKYKTPYQLKGGKSVLALIFAVSLFIFVQEVLKLFGIIYA